MIINRIGYRDMTYEGVREKRINLVIQILIIVFFLGEMLL